MNWLFFNLTNVLTVVPAAPDVGLHDIKGPAHIALPLREIFFVVGGVVFVLLLVWFLIRLYKKKKERPVIPERVLSPEEMALKRLSDPLLSQALEKGDFKFFYFGISDAIREYVAGRYSIDAMDLTTHELLSELSHKSESSVIFSPVETFLNHCDLVKFAKFRPSAEEAKGSLTKAFDIVTACEDFFTEKARLKAGNASEVAQA